MRDKTSKEEEREATKEISQGGISGSLDRDTLLEKLSEVIRQTHQKVVEGRIRDIQKEKLRIEWLRGLAYTIAVYSSMLKDREVNELEKRVLELEHAVKKP